MGLWSLGPVLMASTLNLNSHRKRKAVPCHKIPCGCAGGEYQSCINCGKLPIAVMREPELLQSLFYRMGCIPSPAAQSFPRQLMKFGWSSAASLLKLSRKWDFSLLKKKEITQPLMTEGSEYGMGLGMSLLRTVLCGFGFAHRMFESFSHCGCWWFFPRACQLCLFYTKSSMFGINRALLHLWIELKYMGAWSCVKESKAVRESMVLRDSWCNGSSRYSVSSVLSPQPLFSLHWKLWNLVVLTFMLCAGLVLRSRIGSVLSQGFGQPDLARGLPAHGRGVD